MDFLIKTYPGATKAAEAAANSLNELLSQNSGGGVLLCLSGGSSLDILNFLNSSLLTENVTLTVLDERFSTDAKISNSLQIKNSRIFQEKNPFSFIDAVPEPEENMYQLSERLENSWRSWKQVNPQGKIFALIGMGADGHIAGMLPFPGNPSKFDELFKSNNWAAAYDAGNKSPFRERVTATASFLQQIEEAVVYVTGEQKKPALQTLLQKSKPIAEFPAMGLYEIKKVTVFTDINVKGDL